jgi:hypothetical protein
LSSNRLFGASTTHRKFIRLFIKAPIKEQAAIIILHINGAWYKQSVHPRHPKYSIPGSTHRIKFIRLFFISAPIKG